MSRGHNSGVPRPRVIANFAITADGKVSTRRYTPSLFTSQRDKQRLLEIRAMGDAILAGRGTVDADTMSMRLENPDLQNQRLLRGQTPQPLRVIVSATGCLNLSGKVFTGTGADIVVLSTTAMPGQIQSELAARPGVHLRLFDEEVDLREGLKILLTKFGVQTVVCEGGAALFRSLLAIDAVDELYLTVAPVLFGGEDAPTITGTNRDFLDSTREFELVGMEEAEGECFCHFVAQNEDRYREHPAEIEKVDKFRRG